MDMRALNLGIGEAPVAMSAQMWRNITIWLEDNGLEWPDGACFFDLKVMASRIEDGSLDEMPSRRRLADRWKCGQSKARRIIEEFSERVGK
jgi:hypothetical protein